MKTNHIALVVSFQQGVPVLLDTLTDTWEIQFIEASLKNGAFDPLGDLYQNRSRAEKEDAAFGDYMEALLSRRFLEFSMQRQAVRWLRAKLKLEEFQKKETAASKIISDYAYNLFAKEPAKDDFFIESSHSRVRVHVLRLPKQLFT